MNQRWLDRLATYRRPDEQIDTRAHEVVEIDRELAKAFVQRHHYSASFPAARFSFGLLERGELVGAAVYSHPVRDKVLTNVFPDLPVLQATELGRFVLLDRVAGNGETWFLARTFDQLRGRVGGVVSFSDPVPRTTIDGRVVMPGHVGTIYQAANGEYRGRGRREVLRLLPAGRLLARRSYQKIRDGVRGWVPCAAELIRFGAALISVDADEATRRAWLDTWLPRITRPLRHDGNHRYAWRLERRPARRYGAHLAYPKVIDAPAAELRLAA